MLRYGCHEGHNETIFSPGLAIYSVTISNAFVGPRNQK